MHDYYEAMEFVNLYSLKMQAVKDIDKESSVVQRPSTDLIDFQEAERQKKQKKMFLLDKEIRK